MDTNDRTPKRSSSAAPRKTNTSASRPRSASSQRPANAQRTQSSQRSAAQRPNSAQRTQSGQRPAAQRPANGQRPAAQRPANGQRPANAQRRPQQAHRRKKRRVNPILIVLIVVLVLAIAVMGGIGVYAMRYANYDKIMPNVYVAGIDVGGMTRAEATAAIENAYADPQEHKVSVILPDQVLTFAPGQDNLLIDVDSAVEQAYAYGRGSTSPMAIARAIQAAQRTRNDIELNTSLQVDTEYISELIDSTAASVATQMQDSTVTSDPSAHTITVTIGTPGRSLNTGELYDLVYNAFINGDYSDIDFDYDMTYPAAVQLDTLYQEMTVQAQDAVYDPDTGDISAEAVGYTPATSLDQANQQLAMASAGDVLTFTFEETQPTVTASELEELLFRDTLMKYGSVYASNPGRTENLRLACEAINGTVLQPGDVFSFNQTVGERTADKGYKEAIVYVSGESESELGGGVCQVASTIYYCAMYADLEIVERSPHMFTVTYVPGGLDATVYWGSLDFQFKNSTDYPMRIEAYLSGGRCWIELIGTDVTGNTAEIKSVQTSSSPKIVYTITRYIYDKDGNLIRTDSTADLDNLVPKLGTSTYDLHNSKTSSSPKVSSSPSASPSTSPSTEPSSNPGNSGSGGGDSGSGGGDSGSGGGDSGSGGGDSGGGSSGGGDSGGGSSGGGDSGGGSSGGGDSGGGSSGGGDAAPAE